VAIQPASETMLDAMSLESLFLALIIRRNTKQKAAIRKAFIEADRPTVAE
jgi:hypothetical protein